ncbi:Predicted arabinose efflux permease, MFS family [Pseudoxanthomonas sp. GM95]|uniref:MFS transporter n=1 Tax=Pseudoxanthomonas sp. GM95 TaxID=1881043 RepID=UPI0008D6C2EC|nr:MFS transporter [Pseudoxanthomonas sp. GM95]SEM52621.1 Predicted arabinose efflux permease, MFS family [Pseudoxanthomonas sp. GM95]
MSRTEPLQPAGNATDRWWRGATTQQWNTFRSAYLGWALDIMDLMLFAMVIKHVGAELGFDKSAAGIVVSATLLATAAGGLVFGYLADRIGRAKSMMLSIICYSVGTALCGLSGSLGQLMLFRVIVGLGVGGEWSAGSALVSETWPAKHRGKVMAWVQSAFAAGYALAAIVAAVVVPIGGWRWVFAVGLIPALLAFYVRRHVEEPEIWSQQTKRLGFIETVRLLFTDHARGTIVGLAFTMTAMCGYWGLFTWIPTYLATPVAEGGPGLDLVKSTVWIVIMQVGAALGFITFGYIADYIGRKKAFILFFVASAVSVPIFATIQQPAVLMAFGIVVAYFGTGFYSGFAPTFAELFPTSVRATAQGFVYNGGRAFAAIAPALIGFFASNYGVSVGLIATAGFFALAALIVLLFLPETRGVELT